MQFEIDVSGEDILNAGYSIAVANKDVVNGFKFSRELIQVLRSRQGEGKYRYSLSKQGKALFRVRLYCIAIYFIFKELKGENKLKDEELFLHLCTDFKGHERDITSILKPLLESLSLKINKPKYHNLPQDSPADRYAYLMSKDTRNQMKCYTHISIEDFEKYLVKK